MTRIPEDSPFRYEWHEVILLRRYLQCATFVILWVVVGFYLRLGPFAFQLVGLPLTAGFQLAIARRPLHQLWARDARKFRVDGRVGVLALLWFAGWAALLGHGIGRTAKAQDGHWLLALVAVGVVPAAFAWREQRAADLRRALGWIVLAVAFRWGWHAAWAPSWGGPLAFSTDKLPDFLSDWIGQAVALFLIDEVVFRGALDPYLESAGSGRLHEWCSAIFVSMLWGVGHFPAWNPGAQTVRELFTHLGPDVFAAIILGTLLAFCARRSRTLAPSAAVHAAGNAYLLTLIK